MTAYESLIFVLTFLNVYLVIYAIKMISDVGHQIEINKINHKSTQDNRTVERVLAEIDYNVKSLKKRV